MENSEIKNAQILGKELLEKCKKDLKDLSNRQEVAGKKVSRLNGTLEEYGAKKAEIQDTIAGLLKGVSDAIYTDKAETVEASRSKIRGLRQDQIDCESLITEIKEGLVPKAEDELKKASIRLRDYFIKVVVEIRKADWDSQMDFHGQAMADLSAKWDEVIRQAGEASEVRIAFGSISQDEIGQPSYSVETQDRMGVIYR